MGMIYQEQYGDPRKSPQYRKTDKKKNDEVAAAMPKARKAVRAAQNATTVPTTTAISASQDKKGQGPTSNDSVKIVEKERKSQRPKLLRRC
jgi:hypothetical protein